jgi:hypothetical protein
VITTDVGVIPAGTTQASVPASKTMSETMMFLFIWLFLGQMIPLTDKLKAPRKGTALVLKDWRLWPSFQWLTFYALDYSAGIESFLRYTNATDANSSARLAFPSGLGC